MRGPPLLLLALLASLHTFSDAASWCYSSQRPMVTNCSEPCQWGTINKACDGASQSPIGISTKNAVLNVELKPFSFEGYDKENEVVIKNNGHSVQATLGTGISISGGGLSSRFQASQFHLHWGDGTYGGSEHLIDSVRYAAELHIVHQRVESLDGAPLDQFNYAVLAFFYKIVPDNNQEYAPLIEALKNIPYKDNTTKITKMKLKNLIPGVEKLDRYFRYEGSLTTPNCVETVLWTVFEEEIKLSRQQMEAFSQRLYFPDGQTKMKNNYRPMQELNSRTVFRASASTPLLHGVTVFITSAFVYLVTGLQR